MSMPAPKKEPEWVQPFLVALGSCGNVTRSAKLAGVDVTGVYNRRLRYPHFKAACQQVIATREARAAGVGPSTGSGQGGVADEETPSPLPLRAMVPLPTEGRGEELKVSGAGVRRVAASRWSKGAEDRFLGELTVNANVARAAAAAGFSAAAIYKRKLRDRHFSDGWEAAIAVGRSRLETYLIVAAERSFDPEGLPVAEGAPKVSVSEAISILKHKPAAAAAGSGFPTYQEEADALSENEMAAIHERIIGKLKRVKAREDRERAEEGWTQDGENWVPPGWVKAIEPTERPAQP